MKKVCVILLAAVICLGAGFWVLIHTNADLAARLGLASGPGKPVEIRSGSYFLKLDGDPVAVPYLYLDLESNSAHLSGGMAMSYAETGSVTITDSQVLVETALTTYVFRVQDGNTLILTDYTGDNPFRLPIGGELLYNEEWS